MQPESKQDLVRQWVQTSLTKAKKYTTRLRSTHTGLVISGLVSSAATTLVAGGTAAHGPIIGTSIAGWRLACIVAACFSFLSTVCVGIGIQLKLGERLPLVALCVGRLQALEVAMVTGSRPWEEISKEYEAIVKEYPEVLT